jgi:hypothetical protein
MSLPSRPDHLWSSHEPPSHPLRVQQDPRQTVIPGQFLSHIQELIARGEEYARKLEERLHHLEMRIPQLESPYGLVVLGESGVGSGALFNRLCCENWAADQRRSTPAPPPSYRHAVGSAEEHRHDSNEAAENSTHNRYIRIGHNHLLCSRGRASGEEDQQVPRLWKPDHPIVNLNSCQYSSSPSIVLLCIDLSNQRPFSVVRDLEPYFRQLLAVIRNSTLLPPSLIVTGCKGDNKAANKTHEMMRVLYEIQTFLRDAMESYVRGPHCSLPKAAADRLLSNLAHLMVSLVKYVETSTLTGRGVRELRMAISAQLYLRYMWWGRYRQGQA